MALNAQILEGHWNEIKGKLHERWGALTDDELQRAKGNVDQLVGAIQRKTGESREAIRKYLDEVADGGATKISQAAEAVRGFAANATESVQDAAQQASESVRSGMREGRQVIRQHPFESVMACFGAGLVTGVVLGILCRSR
jgi:uncharacterized protein YjbJ (UPF0337 family)